MADFVIADVTDSMLDGYIAGFPTTFSKKVGKTSDSMYKGRRHYILQTAQAHAHTQHFCGDAPMPYIMLRID